MARNERDLTAPLDNTELGDTCVDHGGTWEGSYSDAVGVDVENPFPICSEVTDGYERVTDGPCRFGPQVDAEGRTEADWAAMGQDEFNTQS